MPYIPLTDAEKADMLSCIGVQNMPELWRQILGPEPVPSLTGLPNGRSEFEVSRYLSDLAAMNATDLVCFVGSGFYDHLIPAAVDDVTGRTEFYTAYTPYQPEASQGTLQAIYEYQSAICRLTGMEVANASLYDGGTALFEAVMMAVRMTRRRRAVLLGSVSPIHREMLRCYCTNLDVDLVVTPAETVFSAPDLCACLSPDTACVIAQYPNVFGVVEDYRQVIEMAKEAGAVSICSAYPIALALLKPPGELGFDIATGEGQSLGIPLSFGGPYLGYMATWLKNVRKMPGRICGRTVDREGRDGYVLTLQTREQHIRRERATSNICTNQGLCALRAMAYLTFVGRQGLVDVARLSAAKAVYARQQLLQIPGIEADEKPFFNEFVLRLPVDAAEVVGRMIERGFAAGFPMGRYFPERRNELLVAVTEKRTREEVRGLAVALEAVLAECH
ncbi:MAG: aminomethyl-transferring glycine dehydrogenase subunit GcvPA [Lentisphaerae bacterium]|jgi:glycine dehydrogenase subunit 1|nr:aminomethyl-transferring glycine dehydrogenase subunit GcvPA [Lentisphaerota bacterium]MBT4815929.1 aminomethyl-transferring glycine dehydrogenase subunit GcvPA [Lentisphaerota bacterium]MBT5611597.1 aminomethyl-transferring glycine dehydrogenase subunit GcvPA [Lentisphaerota bacterium]MBT7061696.1 aminomethyl-transferring glycine dehydrogenase subunit GcvPA [Lentisphaerota bacterium]MBT7846542.1 aminomethyl-transferring glycine dehydrogenase subunit GcvPA [Lentisphaerota bacterium]